jgi:hypothetical protein
MGCAQKDLGGGQGENMNITVVDCPQRSGEWFAARAGRLTGSRADVILMKGKGGGESVTRRDYRLQLALERLTGMSADAGFQSADMARGESLEPWALAAYEAATGVMVMRTGFIRSDDSMVGCSLDGHFGELEGILEIKCPKSATHLGYLRDPPTLVKAYEAQLRHNLWITGATYADIVSFDDRLPAHLQLVKVRVATGQMDIGGYAAAAAQFLSEVDTEVTGIGALRQAVA